MQNDMLFLTALQGGLVLGLIHGVNPCGHSWLVLAPFTAGSRDPGRVAGLTAAFISGTSLACLLIGLTLGGVSMSLPPSLQKWTDLATAGILMVLGLILVVKPGLLHHHGHESGHDHSHDHGHGRHNAPGRGSKVAKATALGLFTFGFVNMIVPCPTAAIMYSYALRSGDPWRGTAVFGAYALGTGAALAGVIWALYKTTSVLRALDKPWLEPLFMRTIGVATIGFAVYSLWIMETPTQVIGQGMS